MKIVLFSLLCLTLIGMISYSYAQFTMIESVDENTVVPEVLLQLELRDSNGGLLAYFESDQILSISPIELNKFLDIQNQTIKEFFIKDDKKYESQKWEIRGDAFTLQSAYSITRLMDVQENELETLLQMRHDSFQTFPGDTSRLFWTIIRPAS